MDSQKLKSNLVKGIAEVALITVGILGAFAVDDWQEEQKIQKLTHDTLELVFSELDDNRCALVRAHAHHSWVRERFVALGDNPTKADYESLFKLLYSKGIIKPAELLSLAWETSINTGAMRHINLQDANQISRLYYHMNQYRDSFATLDSAMTQTSFQDLTTKQYLSGVISGIDDMWWIEKRLLTLYSEPFNKLRAKYALVQSKCNS